MIRIPIGTAVRLAVIGSVFALVAAGSAHAQTERQPPIDEAARTPGGLIEALYQMVSFGPGPEPDWEMFREVFLVQAIIVLSPRGSQPMRPMTVDGFIQDWKDFYRDAELEDEGFYETIAEMSVEEFGGLAHAWVIFEPRIGADEPERQVRGLDSIELSYDGSRWWVAAITTDVEGRDQTIPESLIP